MRFHDPESQTTDGRRLLLIPGLTYGPLPMCSKGKREVRLSGMLPNRLTRRSRTKLSANRWDDSCERSINAPQRVQLITLMKACQAFLVRLNCLLPSRAPGERPGRG